jgi:branched-subunit amino acid ABC-type transport system permease component
MHIVIFVPAFPASIGFELFVQRTRLGSEKRAISANLSNGRA